MEKKYTYLKDYKELDYKIETAYLTFELDENITTVKSVLKVVKSKNATTNKLILNGEELNLKSVKINGKVLDNDEYTKTDTTLEIETWPEEFVLEIENEISPIENKQLEGLYKSDKILCTQNEPEGFRKITYFIDRPDNMAIFTTKIIGDKKKYPYLLSNGNLIEEGDIGKNKHYAIFEDPFKKPSYLFALVAGNFDLLKSTYTTSLTNKKVFLEIYSDPNNKELCSFAMESLKRAMLWDEKNFGRECDLSTYRIVAVDSFNMGAMENKGLNIFNSQRILASPQTTTDNEYIDIEDVIGHEYFHNWTGNRITCRDWFQLTLKEGLTIYRDQEFSADMQNREISRIEEINFLKTHQFPEDESGASHSIKPDKYIEINNFYTATIYWKGAEVIRMLETFFGKKGFRKGMDLYFKRHDGQAITTSEFVKAHADASKVDLNDFEKWYSKKGILKLDIKTSYDEKKHTFKIKISQKGKDNNLFPFKIALLNRNGKELPIELKSKHHNLTDEKRGVLAVSKKEEEFIFTNIKEKPIPSLNRDFSTPAVIKTDLTYQELDFLIKKDNNIIAKYELLQNYYLKLIKDIHKKYQQTNKIQIDENYFSVFETILNNSKINSKLKTLLLTFPNNPNIYNHLQNFDPLDIYKIRNEIHTLTAEKFKNEFLKILKTCPLKKTYEFNEQEIAKRALRGFALKYHKEYGDSEKEIFYDYKNSFNMTDKISTLIALKDKDTKEREKAFNDFYKNAKNSNNLLSKYFMLKASSDIINSKQLIEELENDPKLNWENPNLVRSFMAGVASNVNFFYSSTGSGFKYFINKIIEIDKYNSHLASRLLTNNFKQYKQFNETYQKLIEKELKRLLKQKDLSKNTYEIASNLVG